MRDPYECECGERMVKRSCRLDRDAGLLVRYLRCSVCQSRRTLMVRPEEVVQVVLSALPVVLTTNIAADVDNEQDATPSP